MRRRDFITVIASSVVVWPPDVRAQQPDRMRRMGVLMNVTSNNPEGQPAIAAFQQALQQSGWSEGRNVQIDVRWAGNDVELSRTYAAELIALTPDVILAAGP